MDGHKNPVKVFAKNKGRITNAPREAGPAHNRAPGEFMEMGGKGDPELFGNDNGSIYSSNDTVTSPKSAQKQKPKPKNNGR